MAEQPSEQPYGTTFLNDLWAGGGGQGATRAEAARPAKAYPTLAQISGL